MSWTWIDPSWGGGGGGGRRIAHGILSTLIYTRLCSTAILGLLTPHHTTDQFPIRCNDILFYWRTRDVSYIVLIAISKTEQLKWYSYTSSLPLLRRHMLWRLKCEASQQYSGKCWHYRQVFVTLCYQGGEKCVYTTEKHGLNQSRP